MIFEERRTGNELAALLKYQDGATGGVCMLKQHSALECVVTISGVHKSSPSAELASIKEGNHASYERLVYVEHDNSSFLSAVPLDIINSFDFRRVQSKGPKTRVNTNHNNTSQPL